MTLTTKPNMNDLFNGGSDAYDHSFYLYSGSDTEPPCAQSYLKFYF